MQLNITINIQRLQLNKGNSVTISQSLSYKIRLFLNLKQYALCPVKDNFFTHLHSASYVKD